MVQRKPHALLVLFSVMVYGTTLIPAYAATELATQEQQTPPVETVAAEGTPASPAIQEQIPPSPVVVPETAPPPLPVSSPIAETEPQDMLQATSLETPPVEPTTTTAQPPPPANAFAYPTAPVTPPEPAQQSVFEEALAHVYLRHPQLAAERKNLESTDESIAQAISGFRPSAAINYNRGRARNNSRDGTWFYADNESESISVTQPIFQGGQTLAEYASAKDRINAGRARLTALEQDVLLTAVVAYTDVVEKQYVLEVNQHNVDVLGKQLSASQARFDVGELTRTDVAQSQARLASAQAAERQALGNLAASRATFRRVIGYDPPQHVFLPKVPKQIPANLEEASRMAELNNPVLEAARHLEKATDSDIDIRTATLWPDVNLEGSISRRNVAVAGFFQQVENKNDQIALNVTIPLYQSGAEWSRIRQAKNLAQQAKFNVIDTRYSVVENVSRAWQDYHTAKAIIKSNEQAVKAAQEALDGVRQENLYGTRTILDVLDTEQDFFNARVNLVIATVAEKQQAYRLLAAVGHLTAQDLKLAVDLIDPKTHYDDIKYQLIGF
jgi:outer membrane protein